VIEMIFIGIGELKAEAVFKGMPMTVLWLNEVDTLHRDVLNYGLPRVGRYPAAKDGGCAWSGIIADFNAPEVDNWTYDLLVNKNLGVPTKCWRSCRRNMARISASSSGGSRAAGRPKPRTSITFRRAITTA
jgi:hypothetical protein